MPDMKGSEYLGVEQTKTIMEPKKAVLWIVGSYGQIDGSHHKLWVLDQVARLMTGSTLVKSIRRWRLADGTIYSENDWNVSEPTEAYFKWVEEMKGEWDEEMEEYEYDYDEGIAP